MEAEKKENISPVSRDKKRRGPGQKLQDFMASYRGKVIMNYAYSWGAAIVIAGTLFKLTHLPGANLMLWLGMGTEVLVFFISAFDLPDKSTPVSYPALSGSLASAGVETETSGSYALVSEGEAGTPVLRENASTPRENGVSHQNISSQEPFLPKTASGMETATQAYIDQLKELTETLSRFSETAGALTRDTEQMNMLNRSLSGINAIYEMQLRSVTSQIGTIDEVHEQTRRMARQIEELNKVYARMLQAVQVSRPE